MRLAGVAELRCRISGPGPNGIAFMPQQFDTNPDWGSKTQALGRDSTLSTFSSLFDGISWTHTKKTLKLVKLPNSFFMYAIYTGYQRREFIPAHQRNRCTAK